MHYSLTITIRKIEQPILPVLFCMYIASLALALLMIVRSLFSALLELTASTTRQH